MFVSSLPVSSCVALSIMHIQLCGYRQTLPLLSPFFLLSQLLLGLIITTAYHTGWT